MSEDMLSSVFCARPSFHDLCDPGSKNVGWSTLSSSLASVDGAMGEQGDLDDAALGVGKKAWLTPSTMLDHQLIHVDASICLGVHGLAE